MRSLIECARNDGRNAATFIAEREGAGMRRVAQPRRSGLSKSASAKTESAAKFPAVLLISPKPEPLMMFAGSPMFTMLKRLKNSPRNCRSTRSAPLLRRPNGVSLISAKSKS